MKVSGFTFVRNAIRYDYPIVEAIRSIEPLCDEIIVAVGNSDDDTLALIRSITSNKIRIIETVWDDTLREGGRVLAVETDKAFQAISPSSDWAFYIQGDEILHEQYLATVKESMLRYKNDPSVDGLLFNYLHFYGSYDYVGESLHWYRREIRVIKNNKGIFSYKDAQGFRKRPNEKLRVKHIDATIHHYGWVKDPKAMQGKQLSFNKYWHDDQWIEKNVVAGEAFDYSKVDSLKKFVGNHPGVILERIKKMNWEFSRDMSHNKLKTKDRLKLLVEKITGWRPGEYRNYKIV
jgi:glycosyltransferase involved in cell wall biosynthesis